MEVKVQKGIYLQCDYNLSCTVSRIQVVVGGNCHRASTTAYQTSQISYQLTGQHREGGGSD